MHDERNGLTLAREDPLRLFPRIGPGADDSLLPGELPIGIEKDRIGHLVFV